MLVARRAVLAVACVAVLPTLAHAQAGFRAGFAFENGKRAYQQGLSLEGSYTVRGTKPLGVRFDVGVHGFSGEARVAALLCPTTGCPPRSWNLTVMSSSASLVLTKDLGANKVYWLAGIGGYALNDEPTVRYARFGWNGGAGILIGKHGVAEVRYHGIVDPLGSRGFVPISVGFRF